MMRRARLPLAVFTLTFLIACQSDNLTRSIDSPMYAVSDGAHDGNPDFFFLSPLFKNPSSNPNFEPAAFNGSLRPAVEICELGAPAPDNTRACVAGPPIRRFAPGTVNVSTADQQYHVNWNTDESSLNVTSYYRIRVLVGPTELGFADLDPVSSGKDLKNVQTGEYIGLVDGRTLPIKFRIESGALCAADGTPCASETITLAQGGGIELVIPGEDFHFDVPPGTQATSNGQVVTEVTFNLETCDGVDVDLPKVGECLRVTALYDAAGTSLHFSLPILISMCSYQPVEGQEELITLHQQDGDLIRALPHADPNCDVIGATTVESSNLALRGWRWIRDLAAEVLTPQPLYAGTRTTLLHVGGGGETTRLGADCTSAAVAKMALAECVPAVAQLTPFPSAGQTISDFQFALPAKMDYVDPDDASRRAPAGTSLPTAVKVTDWNDAPVQGATVTFTALAIEGPGTVIGTAVSNSDGVAQISWPIVAGNNTLVASGRGIAAQNNYPDATVKPFMPDIFSGAPQTPVIVGTGEITFTATGITTATALIDCLTTGATGGDQLDRGFYIPEYPGATLDRVELSFSADAAGEFTISLTARANTYDGPVIGTATAVVTLPANRNLFVQGTFDFSNAAVAPGTTVTFALAQVSGPSTTVFYEVPSAGNAACSVVQTNGTEAPLSTVRRNGVEVRLFGTAGAVLDQQNLLDGSIGGQGIGRFSDANGAPDPDGTSFDFQDAQTFTVGASGRLAQIKVPLINNSEATTGVTMEIVPVVDGVPDEANSLGEVTIPATAIPTDFAAIGNPAAWATFDVSSLEINVVEGQMLAYIVRSLSTSAYLYNPEFSFGYASGSGYRRNRALSAAWSNSEADFGFQTFVIPN
jgi:hypothetical protein